MKYKNNTEKTIHVRDGEWVTIQPGMTAELTKDFCKEGLELVEEKAVKKTTKKTTTTKKKTVKKKK